ncbi:hypothetical protein KY339_03280 [Candidatus Woesearchaeota archaeon]|nr:hypothetical protein [Candidatus Woesearchaeota archaeon]
MSKKNKTSKRKNEDKNTLEQIVESKKSRVYVLSEVGFDTDYFNPKAYDNLLELMSQDKEISGVIIDGALTRLDRPEFLNDELSYWKKSEKECMEETENIPNKRQYKSMRDTQLSILEQKLREIKDKVPQAKEIVFSIDSDDIQYTVSAMVNEMLLRGQKEIKESITKLREKRKGWNKEYTKLQKEYERLEKIEDSGRKKAGLKKRINNYEGKIERIEEKIKDKSDEQKLYREKKARPAHQYFTARFVKKLYRRYQELCDSIGVKLVTKPSVLQFDNLVVEYAHSRHATWAMLKRRDKALLESTHGKLDKDQKKAFNFLKKASAEGIDVILESGHAGIGYKQFQKIKDNASETNFKNQSLYDPDIAEEHITIVMALPFEDQEKVSRFVKGEEPVRMSGGKPMNTRKHAAVDRDNNDSVSGLTVITQDENGLIGTEWIQYQNFADGSVLKQPEEYSIICASSDEHIGAPEENLMARDGLIALYNKLLKKPSSFRGKKAFAKGYINGGDVAEANSRKWNHRYHYKRDPHELLRENIAMLTKFSPDNIEKIIEMAMKMTNDAKGGSVESMAVILERAADYYERLLKGTLKQSKLKCAHASVTGNHSDDVLRDLGLRESDFFVQRLKAKGINVYEVGRPDYFEEKNGARVFIGGYSNARILNITDYGKDVNGRTMFGPINLILQHDPKGSGFKGLVGAGKNVGADVALAGHTHDNWLKIYKTGDNTFSVAYRLATMQSVSPTEKMYAGSVPRTHAAHCLVMPMPGDFSEKTMPATYLRDEGRKSICEIAGKEFRKNKRKKK